MSDKSNKGPHPEGPTQRLYTAHPDGLNRYDLDDPTSRTVKGTMEEIQ